MKELDQLFKFDHLKKKPKRWETDETNPKSSEAGSDLRGGATESASFRQDAKRGLTEARDMKFAPTRSSIKERKGNALASGADEGRDKLR